MSRRLLFSIAAQSLARDDGHMSDQQIIERLQEEVSSLRDQLISARSQANGVAARFEQLLGATREADRTLKDWAIITSMACQDGRCFACGEVTEKGKIREPKKHKRGCLGVRTRAARDTIADVVRGPRS